MPFGLDTCHYTPKKIKYLFNNQYDECTNVNVLNLDKKSTISYFYHAVAT